MDGKDILNEFYERIYNRIFSIEESELVRSEFCDLSARELRIIDAVARQAERGKNNMGSVARYLSLSAGALSVAVSTLANKNYLFRSVCEDDRRKVFIRLTETGERAAAWHRDFHKKIIDNMALGLSAAELETLALSLLKVGNLVEIYD